MRCLGVLFFVVTVPLGAAPQGEREPVELVLRLRESKMDREPRLEILVKNRSGRAVEISSKEFLPAFTLTKWFEMTVDGRAASYAESIVLNLKTVETWRIPPGGVVLWADIPLRELTVRTRAGLERAIKDGKRHTIKIMPSKLWKDLKVKAAELEVGK